MSKKIDKKTVKEIKGKINEAFKEIFGNKTVEEVTNELNLGQKYIADLSPTEILLVMHGYNLQKEVEVLKTKLKMFLHATHIFSVTLRNFMALYGKEMTEMQRKLEINKLKGELDEDIKKLYI